MKRLLALLLLSSVSSAQTYYEKTTIPPKIPANTVLGNSTGATAAPGALTTIPSAAVPVYSGDCGNAIATSVLVCTQAAANFNVVGTLSEAILNPPTNVFVPQEIDFTGTGTTTLAPNVTWNNTTGGTNYKAWNCNATAAAAAGNFICGTQTVNAAGQHNWINVTRGGTNPYDISDISFGSAGTSNNTTHFLGTGTVFVAGLIAPTSSLGIVGTVAVDNPSAGSIGEVFSINCPVGTAAAAATTVTMTIATPAVVTWSSHTFVPVGAANYTCPINFTTTGALPTGVVAGTTYYIIGSTVSGDTFQISDTAPHALASTNAVATSGSQSGTQAAYIGNVGATTTAFAGAGMSITAGDWDCTGLSEYQELTTLTTSRFVAGVHTSVVLTSIGTFADNRTVSGAIGANNYYMTAPSVRQTVNAATTLYLLDSSTFSVGTMNEAGFLRCRRMR